MGVEISISCAKNLQLSKVLSVKDWGRSEYSHTLT